MRTINFSDARNNFKAVLDRVVEDADVTIITRRDADDVVVMSLAEWNSWQETNYLLASPANARRLYQAIADLDAGKGVERQLIDPDAAPHQVHEAHARYHAKPKAKSKRSSGKRISRRG
ncbi:MAG: type II toxin-antitoxin system prevent-host-death family antitoxin [Rhodanobacteraceae bacterium]